MANPPKPAPKKGRAVAAFVRRKRTARRTTQPAPRRPALQQSGSAGSY